MKKLGLLLLTLVLLASCSKDDIQSQSVPSDGGNVQARFSLAVNNNMDVSLNVRSSDATVDTTKIENLWVVQFNYSADGTGTIIGTPQYLEGFDPANIAVDLSSDASNVYFIANTYDANTFNSTNCATENQFKALKKLYTSAASIQNDMVNTKKTLPMTGALSNVQLQGMITNPVVMTRSVAKVEFSYTTAFPAGQSFTITGVRLCYAPTTIKYSGATEADFLTDAAADYFDYPVETITTGVNDQNGSFMFYMPENLKGTDQSGNTEPRNKSGLSGRKCSYIEVKGTTGNGTSVIYKIFLGNDDIADYNVNRNKDYKVTATFMGTSLFDYRITQKNDLRREESNCYMMTPSSTIYIPVNRANTGNLAAGLVAPLNDISNSNWTCGLVWSDATGGGTTAGVVNTVVQDPAVQGYIKVTAGTAIGNAVVCVKNSSNNIVWSWHIWVTNYVPETRTNGTTSGLNGVTFMDRNLGAEVAAPVGATPDVNALGLLYQWGRKDPFVNTNAVSGSTTAATIYSTGSTTVTMSTAAATSSLFDAIKAPLTMYYNTTNPYDWYTSTTNNDLWGGTATVPSKTVFDPCPTGWRVPKQEAWTGIAPSFGTYNSLTYTWKMEASGAGNFPLAGQRGAANVQYSAGSPATGVLPGVGGSYWTATPNGSTGAYFLSLNTASVNVTGSQARANVCSVRCVRE
ncbi:MAG: Fimbrillin-A associated anchor protein Mfa1 and Mfa2 [Bacteroidetes bacterium]|nr:Fimbrillin-A associated anchor protein Mfa1 and Mfa2 [Bacteroidota bacterium]